jgi:hypothetical protein
MIALRDKESGLTIGTISESDLALLVDMLEEESPNDTDYYVEAGTIELLEDEGASVELLALLRSALGTKEGVELEWTRS